MLIFSALAILQLVRIDSPLPITLTPQAYDAHLEGPNYYQRLHVDREASLQIIKKSFKKLSLELHPDKNRSPGAAEKYLSVKAAYEVCGKVFPPMTTPAGPHGPREERHL